MNPDPPNAAATAPAAPAGLPDPAAVLALLTDQLRRNAPPDGATARVEQSGRVVRQIDPGGWNGVVYSDFDPSGADADAGVAEQIAFFRTVSGLDAFEWKRYAEDEPKDLGRRLVAAGFEPGDPETVLVASAAALAGGEPAALPPGVELVDVTGAEGIDLMVHAHNAAFGGEHSRLRDSMLRQLSERPQRMYGVVAMAEGRAVCAARLELNPGTAFAGLWGGGTDPQWRGRGIYRATVVHRARIALAHGATYLQVDASAMSKPILQRLGFTRLTVTTPYLFQLLDGGAGRP